MLSGWASNGVDALLAPAGVHLNGRNPWDPQIQRPRALWRVLTNGTLGAGEAYVDGDWECAALDELASRLAAVQVHRELALRSPASFVNEFTVRVLNRQTAARARQDIQAHYDVGNDMYSAMLGPTMAYSCGYWRQAASLDDAQTAKFDLVCRKVGLQPGQRVLDIGCGWGGLAHFAATHYGVDVVGITLSPAQAALARERCAGLPVDIQEKDYRALDGTFDRIISIGMFEHVGPSNYRAFFEVVRRLIAADGLLLLHTIGGSTSEHTTDPWINRYVFPGSTLPSAQQIGHAIEGVFVLEDWHNFGADYDKTLMAWHANLEAAWPRLSGKYSDRFRRLWSYYLLTCAGTFRARRNQLWQIVLSPDGVPSGYQRVV